MNKYKVGQILYLLSARTMKVFPVQVVEEVVRNSLKGKKVTYTVMLPDKKKSISSLDNVNAEVFEDVAKLRGFMTDNAKISIDQIIENAKTLQAVFDNGFVEEKDSILNEENNESVHIDKNDDKIKVDLGNGMKANIKLEDLEGMPGFNR